MIVYFIFGGLGFAIGGGIGLIAGLLIASIIEQRC